MTQELNEKRIIDRCRNGCEKSWEEIYSLYAPKVKAYIRSFMMSGNEADDICQEVFLEFFKSLDSFRHEASVATFLLKICKYTCIMHLRRKNAAKRVNSDKTIEISEFYDGQKKTINPVSAQPSFEEELIMQEEREKLLSLIPELSEDCKKIIKLRYFYMLSYTELTDKLNMPMGTLASKLKRCIMYLKKNYEKEAGDL